MTCTDIPPATHADLWWSEAGAIACPKHMPFRGSDSFVFGRWRRITKAEIAEFTREVGRAPACETCMAIERREEEEAGRG